MIRRLGLLFMHYVLHSSVKCTDSLPIPLGETINVTGNAAWGDNWRRYTIVVSNATWFDASRHCGNMGTLLSSGSAGSAFSYIRNQLFLHFPELIGNPLWTAFHKPNLDGIWYKGKNCSKPLDRASFNNFANDDSSTRQCILLNTTINLSENIAFSWYGTSCHERHPFICGKTLGKGYLREYKGMVKLTDDDLSVITTFSNSSSAECKTKCNNYRNYHCTFSASDSACVQYKRDIKDLPYEFSLIYAGNDTTSYVKTQFNEVVKTTIAVPDDAYNNSDLPCYRDPVSIKPPSQIISMGSQAYADTSTEVIAPDVTNTPYISPHQLQQLVDDIKEENTVDTKTLSSYKNKLISAEDNRPSAMVIGYAGAIFIGLFFGLILLLDIPKLIMDLTSLHRREREHITMDDEERILVKSTLRRRRPKLNNRRCLF